MNVILNASFAQLPFHDAASGWFEEASKGREAVGIPTFIFVAVVRISSNARAFTPPLTTEAAVQICDTWRSLPRFIHLDEGPRLWETFRTLLARSALQGPSITDAYIASLAIHHDATLVTFDRGFARFPDLTWVRPAG